MREATGRLFTPHELELVGSEERFDARLHCHRLADTAINFVAYAGEVLIEGGPTDTYFAILIPLSGVSALRCGGAHITLTQSVGAAVSPHDEDLAIHWNDGSALLVCRVEQPALEAHLSCLLGEYLPRPLHFEPAMPVAHGRGLSVRSRLRALVRDIDRGGRLISHPLSAHAFEHAFMTDLLVAQPHNYSAALNADVKAAGSREVEHAVALIESHPEWPLPVASVAAGLSISGRSLQRAFRRDLDATFRSVLRDIRLRRVRDDLRRSVPAMTSVHDVLARWGLPPILACAQTLGRRYVPEQLFARLDARPGTAKVLGDPRGSREQLGRRRHHASPSRCRCPLGSPAPARVAMLV